MRYSQLRNIPPKCSPKTFLFHSPPLGDDQDTLVLLNVYVHLCFFSSRLAKLTGSPGKVKIWHHLAPVHCDAKTSGVKYLQLMPTKREQMKKKEVEACCAPEFPLLHGKLNSKRSPGQSSVFNAGVCDKGGSCHLCLGRRRSALWAVCQSRQRE